VSKKSAASLFQVEDGGSTFAKHWHLSIKSHGITSQGTTVLKKHMEIFCNGSYVAQVKGRYWTVNSVVSIVTFYRLDSSGFEPWWGEIFRR